MPDREAGEGRKWSDQTDLDVNVESADGPAPEDEPGTKPAWYRRIPAFVWALVALFGGMALGTTFPDNLEFVRAGVQAVFEAIPTAVPFIILLTLLPAMLDMLKSGSAGKFAGSVAIAFTVTTLIAGIWALVVLVPIFQLDLGFGKGSSGSVLGGTGMDLQSVAFEPPIVAIWWSILTALFLHHTRDTRILGWFSRPVADVYHRVGTAAINFVGLAMKQVLPVILLLIGIYIPTGLTESLSKTEGTIAAGGAAGVFGDAGPVTWYFINAAVMAVLLVTFLVAATLFVAWYTRFPAKRILKDYILYVYPFAWATASSAATIPINLDRAEHGLKVRKEVRNFIIPMGATVNLDGTMVGAFVLTVTAGFLIGMPPTFLDLLLLTIPFTIISIGAPGVPGGIAFIAPQIVGPIMGLPPDLMPAYMAIWAGFSFGLSDQFRTGVNTCDNGLICRMFEHWYPTHFEKAVPVDVTDASGERAVSLESVDEESILEQER